MAAKGKGGGFDAVGAALDSAVTIAGDRQLPDPSDDPPVLDPNDPSESAREFIVRRYVQGGVRTLHAYDDRFRAWNGTCYPESDPRRMRHEAYRFLDGALRRSDGNLVKFKPKRGKVDDFLDALKAEAHLDMEGHSPPCWIGGDVPDLPANELLAVRNGLLNLATGELAEPSPGFFTGNALEFGYDPAAKAPNWDAFLQSLWPAEDEREQVECLGEMFGYLLTGETKHHKIFLLQGPTRSGKTTIGKVLRQLVGPDNVASPTLSSLTNTFGMAPLIGKLVGLVGDARLGSRSDQAEIAERLLAVSGEDSLQIERKHRVAWTGRLPTRFVILTNELPRIQDVSGALAGRFVILTLRHTIPKEDRDLGLASRLMLELPGILNWALAGRRRLAERGYFREPESSRQNAQSLEEMASPVTAFVRDRCVTKGDDGWNPDDKVSRSALFEAWSKWSDEENRTYKGNRESFGRDLKSAYPHITSEQSRKGGSRVRFYVGIRLRDDGELQFDDAD